MSKKTKIIAVIVAVAVLIAAGIAAYTLNKVNTNSDLKNFTLVIESERDNFSESIECKSNLGTLGEFLRTLEYCKWEDSSYGIYITGWYDYDQDLDNQYWWALYEDGSMSPTGADEIALTEGHEYKFVLTQGW